MVVGLLPAAESMAILLSQYYDMICLNFLFGSWTAWGGALLRILYFGLWEYVLSLFMSFSVIAVLLAAIQIVLDLFLEIVNEGLEVYGT